MDDNEPGVKCIGVQLKLSRSLRLWGSGHVRVVVTPLRSGFTTDEVRSGSRQKVGVTTVRVIPSRQGAL